MRLSPTACIGEGRRAAGAVMHTLLVNHSSTKNRGEVTVA